MLRKQRKSYRRINLLHHQILPDHRRYCFVNRVKQITGSAMPLCEDTTRRCDNDSVGYLRRTAGGLRVQSPFPRCDRSYPCFPFPLCPFPLPLSDFPLPFSVFPALVRCGLGNSHHAALRNRGNAATRSMRPLGFSTSKGRGLPNADRDTTLNRGHPLLIALCLLWWP